MSTSTRHRWGERASFPLAYKTERHCTRCELVKVSRHDDPHRRWPWIEWWRDGERIETDATPPCDFRLEREGVPA